jgi:anti-repressor protein
MSALEVFTYSDQPVRTVLVDGEPWFVAADVATILGYRMASDLTRSLDADEKGTHETRTPSGDQHVSVITEAGLFKALVQRQTGRMTDDVMKLAVKRFQRWVTHEVLPSIRKTGQYVAPTTDLEQIKALHAAVGTLLEHNERITAQVVTLTPRAEAWDELAAAAGDYEVADAAKILARAGVETGRKRLFDQLAGDLRWIFRGHHGKWSAYQTAVDNGYLTERPQSHHHPRTGAVVLDPPQVRVTVKGLERLRVRLGSLELAQ